MEGIPCVYMLANKRNGSLYIGVTSHLAQRVWQHKNHFDKACHTSRYGIDQLVWFETCVDMRAAITREKQMKAWKRDWKIRLIEEMNPEWVDLYSTLA